MAFPSILWIARASVRSDIELGGAMNEATDLIHVQQGVAAARAVDAVKVYGHGDAAVRALDGITVEFGSARYTAIMGPSGSGKSTLLHCMAGLDRLSAGKVFIGDVDLSTLDEKKLTILRRDKVGFVFQAYRAFGGAAAKGRRCPGPGQPARDRLRGRAHWQPRFPGECGAAGVHAQGRR